MLKFKLVTFALGATLAFAAVPGAVPAFAQSDSAAEAYAAGVKLGRSLQDARQCTGNSEFHGGCVDGVQESQFDRQADQAMDRVTDDTRPDQRAPALSPPPDLFHQPFSKPDDGSPPND
jgi:predicted subunit of tRNA(5-methylaminomethyl-2-thiouridylate) methyltransferase